MSEDTQTPQVETAQQTNTSSLDEHWSDIEIMDRAAQAAKQNFIDTPEAPTVDKNNLQKGIAASVIAVTALGGAGLAVNAATQGPTFSETTSEYVVQPGDGLYDAAGAIKGIEGADVRDAAEHISVDPANIDVLSDGLQPGEVLIIPDSVQK